VKNLIRFALFAVAALSPAPLLAGGFILPSGGARASGMAGAWVAQGDDLSVLDHNPAEMTRLEGTQLQGHYNAYVFQGSFQPAAVSGMGQGPESDNTENYVNHIPNLYGMVPFGEKFRLGYGFFTPLGPRHRYADAGSQRYQIQEAELTLAWPTVAAAYRITKNVSASLSLDVAYVGVKQRFALGLIPGFRSFDGTLTVEGSGVQLPRPKLGVLLQPTDELSVGFVALPGIDLKIPGHIQADVPQAGLSGKIARDEIVAGQRVPTEARLGLGWKNAKWRAEATARYYRWSEYKEQTVDLKRNKIGDFAIADLTVKKFYQNSMAFQLGGGYKIAGRHEVRLGYMYDQQAAKDEGLTIQDFDAPKHLFAIGYGATFAERYTVDLAYNHVAYQTQNVANSESFPIAVLGAPPALGNGKYKWSVDMFLIGLGVTL
jgi:long-chain fatty acid transport protein